MYIKVQRYNFAVFNDLNGAAVQEEAYVLSRNLQERLITKNDVIYKTTKHPVALSNKATSCNKEHEET